MKIWAKTKEFSEGKFLVVRRDATVPNWPHFVLGGRDRWAPVALAAYAAAAEMDGADPEYVASIRELAQDFRVYRDQHGAGDPESGPHRDDNPNVIEAMRNPGCTVGLTVVRLPGE
jgi:hypothetical protein